MQKPLQISWTDAFELASRSSSIWARVLPVIPSLARFSWHRNSISLLYMVDFRRIKQMCLQWLLCLSALASSHVHAAPKGNPADCRATLTSSIALNDIAKGPFSSWTGRIRSRALIAKDWAAGVIGQPFGDFTAMVKRRNWVTKEGEIFHRVLRGPYIPYDRKWLSFDMTKLRENIRQIKNANHEFRRSIYVSYSQRNNLPNSPSSDFSGWARSEVLESLMKSAESLINGPIWFSPSSHMQRGLVVATARGSRQDSWWLSSDSFLRQEPKTPFHRYLENLNNIKVMLKTALPAGIPLGQNELPNGEALGLEAVLPLEMLISGQLKIEIERIYFEGFPQNSRQAIEHYNSYSQFQEALLWKLVTHWASEQATLESTNAILEHAFDSEL
jgi:hypothetical protein